ncbi:Hachiman antiphage defense system protein HamA [Bacteroides reticulotermitis]|uniref:Hachiman antiphage defense system protein HamA n=1 Tax=Bacteroides reticulotermitis TaxID=1133319 RepID=UPI003A89D45C
MSIPGVRYIQQGKCKLALIDSLSNEFKLLIRSQLTGIFWGDGEVSDIGYTYQETLAEFLERYNSKAEETKKGMIGELIANVLISNYFDDFSIVSVMRNIEERSIKKGFDIIYFNYSDTSIWYSEVKSGEKDGGGRNTSSKQNEILYRRAHADMRTKLNSNRVSLWDLAISEAKLSIEDPDNRNEVRRVLREDRNLIYNNDNSHLAKRVILVSVLFADLSDEVDMASLVETYSSRDLIGDFDDIIAVSIQKNTYNAVVSFLGSEII